MFHYIVGLFVKCFRIVRNCCKRKNMAATTSVVKTSEEAKASSKPLNFLRYVASKLKPTNWCRRTKEERMVAKSEYLIER